MKGSRVETYRWFTVQALKEKQTLEQQLRLDRRERLNTQQAAKNTHEKAQAELDESQAEIERRNADVEAQVSLKCQAGQISLASLSTLQPTQLHCSLATLPIGTIAY